jgi:hypothetical protein
MPGLLNSCWIVVAFCAALHYFRSPAHSVSAGRLQRALALGCALAVLFPVISADDDLLQQQIASEADAVSRIIKASANSTDGKSHFSAALPVALVMPVLMSAVEDTVDFLPPAHHALKAHANGDRSPPRS